MTCGQQAPAEVGGVEMGCWQVWTLGNDIYCG